MKIQKSNKNIKYDAKMASVMQASSVLGTSYYKISLEDIIKSIDSNRVNLFLKYAMNMYGLSAINLDTLFGSKIIDNTLYLCVTNGQDIEVNGDLVDPENALENYTLEDLDTYISEASDRCILSHITIYELKLDIFKEEGTLSELIINMLESGEKFQNIVKDYENLNI